jgi:hypothetical protein
MALPWLETLPFAGAAASTVSDQPPTRTLVTFTGMGFHSKHWWAKLKESQSDLLTVVDPALEARLAVSFQSPSKVKQTSAQKPTLEHLPSAIAQAIKDDDDVTQAVEENLALLIAMANSAKAAGTANTSTKRKPQSSKAL